MTVASVVSEKTEGKMYESGARIARLIDTSMSRVVETDDIAPLGEEACVMEGEPGRPFCTAVRGLELEAAVGPRCKGPLE